jgi:hypothetical protein
MIDPFTDDASKITKELYMKYAAQYGVTDLEPPPQPAKRVAASWAAGPDDKPHCHADKIDIPDGYRATGIYASAAGVLSQSSYYRNVTVFCVSAPYLVVFLLWKFYVKSAF